VIRVRTVRNRVVALVAATGILLVVAIPALAADPGIAISKSATPTTLPVGGGSVTYTYVVTNTGTRPLANVTLTDDRCSPVARTSGDTNADNALDPTEVWQYSCATLISATTVNTAVVRGEDGSDAVTAKAQAQVTVATPTPRVTPTGSVRGATSPPRPHVTLPPTDGAPASDTDQTTTLRMVFALLTGLSVAAPLLVLGRRRSGRGSRRG
jgi:hypothetical protein